MMSISLADMERKNKKMIKYGVWILALVGVALVIAYSGGGDDTNVLSYSASALTASEENFNFDTVPINGGNVYHEFSARNEGAEPVIIEKVYTSCMCTTAMITDESGKEYGKFGMPGHGVSPETNVEVSPGESVVVKAIFDPAAHGPSGIGLADRSIYLETNSAKSPKLEFSFQATVTP